MLEKVSAEIQLILVILLIAILFLLVILNNKRNQKKRFDREGRNFRTNFYNKREKRKNK